MTALRKPRPEKRAAIDVIAWPVGALAASFYGVAHASFVEDGRRQQGLLLTAGALCVLAVLTLPLKNRVPIVGRAIAWTALTCTVVLLNHLFLPAQFGYGQTKYQYLILVLVLALFAVPILTFRSELATTRFVQSMAAVSSFYCVVNLVSGTDASNIRKSSIELNPAIMSKICLLLALYAIAAILVKRRADPLQLLLLLLSIGASIKTGSRGPILAVLLSAAIVMVAMYGASQLHRIVPALVGLIVAVGVFLRFAPAAISSRFTLAAVSVQENSGEGDRIDLWRTALHVVDDNVNGIGMGNFLSYQRFVSVPHNIFLEIAVEFGVVIAVAFLAACVVASRRAVLTLRSSTVTVPVVWMALLLLNQIANSLLGGELTLQSYLLYLPMAYFLYGVVGLRKTQPKRPEEIRRRARPALSGSGRQLQ